MSKPKLVDLDQRDLDSLLERVSASNLGNSDKKLLLSIVQCYVWVQFALQEARMSIARLRRAFGFGKTEKCKKDKASEEKESCSESDGDDDKASPPESGSRSEEALSHSTKLTAKGHGRLGYESYTGAEIVL